MHGNGIRTVDAIAAGTLNTMLMIEFKFSTMKIVAIRFAAKLYKGYA